MKRIRGRRASDPMRNQPYRYHPPYPHPSSLLLTVQCILQEANVRFIDQTNNVAVVVFRLCSQLLLAMFVRPNGYYDSLVRPSCVVLLLYFTQQ